MTKKQRQELNSELARSQRCIIRVLNKYALRFMTVDDAINNRNPIPYGHSMYKTAPFEQRIVSSK